MIQNQLKKAVFLDRDGTICRESNYLSRPEDLEIFPFTARAIKLLSENDFLVILITNQSGIGRGFFDTKTLYEIHDKLNKDLAKDGVKLDAIYFCPHISEDICTCRKPETGMILKAEKDFEIDLKKSWMIGDKEIDVFTGTRAGTKTALVLTGYGEKEAENLNSEPDFTGENLLEAAEFIVRFS